MVSEQVIPSQNRDDNAINYGKVSASLNGIRLQPVVLETETTGSANVMKFTDQCGHEESDQTSAGNAQHTLNTLLYRDYLKWIWRLYKTGEKVDLTLPANLDTVGVFITDVTIKQNGDSRDFVDDEGFEETVWPTQIQLKTSGAINSN